HYHVAALEAGLGRWRVLEHLGHEHAAGLLEAQALGQVLVGHVADLHAQVAAADDALAQQLLHDVAGEVGGDGHADALPAARAALDGRVDADDLAFQVDQRAARVAGVDGGVGLEEVLVHVDAKAAALGADDALRHRAGQAGPGP